MARPIAVLTGDLVASSRIADRTALNGALDQVLAELAQRFAAQPERFRGDAFQLALPAAADAMTAAVWLRAALIGRSGEGERWDARVAVAVGPDSWRPGQPLADSVGAPFVLSGQTLDAMTAGEERLRFTASVAPTDGTECVALLTRFADDIVSGWSRYAGEIVHLSLRHEATQQALAARLGRSQPTVHKRLVTARWALIHDYLELMRALASGAAQQAAP